MQYFEARWTDAQRADQFETSRVLRKTVDVAFGFIGERLRAGQKITEYDVQQRMVQYFKENSLVIDDAPNCSVNANGANPHYEPTKEIFSEVKKGDCVLIDLWAKSNKPESVYSDITWVAYAGENIPAKYQKVFEIVKGARDTAVDYLNSPPCDAEHEERGEYHKVKNQRPIGLDVRPAKREREGRPAGEPRDARVSHLVDPHVEPLQKEPEYRQLNGYRQRGHQRQGDGLYDGAVERPGIVG